MRNSKANRGISIPPNVEWTVEDWEDFYVTLRLFKLRLLKRHGLDTKGRYVKKRSKGGAK